MRPLRSLALGALALLVIIDIANAQHFNRSVEFDDFGFTFGVVPGARATALGGAMFAGANDSHALMLNPAGLARIKRVEATLGFSYERHEIQTSLHGASSAVTTPASTVSPIAVAVPIPTVRGSFTLAAGVYRVWSANMDLHYNGTQPTGPTLDDYLVQQSGAIRAYYLGFGVDLATVLSGGASVFFLDGNIESLRQWRRDFISETPGRQRTLSDEVSLSVSGAGARIGAQFFVYPGLVAGLVMTTPTVVQMNGEGTTQVTEHIDDGLDQFIESTGTIETEYLFPFRVDAGINATYYDVAVELGISWMDWTEASIDRRRFRDRQLNPTLKETTDVRVGVEWSMPWRPVRIRGGYAYLPYPLQYLQPDAISDGDIQLATEIDERDAWSAGIGVLFSRMLVDVAWSQTGGSRTVDQYSRGSEQQQFLATISYRF